MRLDTRSHTLTVTIEHIDLRLVSMVYGIPLVDASILWEPHLVRGTQ